MSSRPMLYQGCNRRDPALAEHVKFLQERLADAGFALTVDGDFGRGTTQAVKAFQARYDLTADGWVGNKSWDILEASFAPNKLKPIAAQKKTRIYIPWNKALYPQGQITSPYGWRTNPINGKAQFHNGVDIATMKEGDSQVAFMDGKVTKKFNDKWNGLGVQITSFDGDYSVVTVHMNSVDVRLNQTVKIGQRIGAYGTTGASTGVHSHTGIYYKGNHVDPRDEKIAEWKD